MTRWAAGVPRTKRRSDPRRPEFRFSRRGALAADRGAPLPHHEPSGRTDARWCGPMVPPPRLAVVVQRAWDNMKLCPSRCVPPASTRSRGTSRRCGRSSLAGARTRFADENAKALKAVEALSKAKTPSQFSSKRRDVERHQKATAAQEKRIGEIEKQIAAKQKSLKSAEESLARAKREESKKDERDAEKRRRADIDHLKQMERERRSVTALPEGFAARPRARVLSALRRNIRARQRPTTYAYRSPESNATTLR